MTSPSTLASAVVRAAKGDHEAFRAVFDAGNDKLFRYFLSHTGDREAALDLLQDTFIDLWKGLPKFQFRTEGEFWGFVFMIAKRKLHAHWSKRGRTEEVLLDETTLEALIPVALQDHPEYQDYRTLNNALGKLSGTSREVLALRYWSELSFKEIAIAAQVSESAAKVRHHRAIHELQAHLPEGYFQESYA